MPAERLPFPPTSAPEDPVVVGRIVRPIGLRGDVKVVFESGNTGRLEGVERLILRVADECYGLDVRSAEPFSGWARVRVAGVDTLESAELLRGGEILIAADELPGLKEGEFYVDQIIGCRAESEDGLDLGVVEDIYLQAHCDLWVVRGPLGEILIPSRERFVARVDLAGQLVVVRCIAGLWEGA